MAYTSFKVDFNLLINVDGKESSHIASMEYYDSDILDSADITVDFEDGDGKLSDEVVDVVDEVVSNHFCRMTIKKMQEQDGETIVVKYNSETESAEIA